MRPNSTRFNQTRPHPKLEQTRPNLTKSRLESMTDKHFKNFPVEFSLAMDCPIRPTWTTALDQSRPNSIRSELKMTALDPVRPNSTNTDKTRPNSIKPNWTKPENFKNFPAEFSLAIGCPIRQTWTNALDQSRPNSTRSQVKLTALDPMRPNSTKIDRNRPNSTKLEQMRPLRSTKVDQTLKSTNIKFNPLRFHGRVLGCDWRIQQCAIGGMAVCDWRDGTVCD